MKWCIDDRALEEEVEKKFGWMLKIFFIGTAGLVGWQFFPYMGMTATLWSANKCSTFQNTWLIINLQCCSADENVVLFDKFSGDNLLQQSITLLHVKDPLFKRMGASRLARFAIDGNQFYLRILFFRFLLQFILCIYGFYNMLWATCLQSLIWLTIVLYYFLSACVSPSCTDNGIVYLERGNFWLLC
jgi:hypothetical protein